MLGEQVPLTQADGVAGFQATNHPENIGQRRQTARATGANDTTRGAGTRNSF